MAAFAAMLMVSAFVPTVAFGQTNLVNDLLKGVQGILGGGGGGGGGGDGGGGAGQVSPQQAIPPGYQPPLHGSNPHGQGTVATVDTDPSDERPLSGDFDADGEEIIVGQANGGQDANGDYNGRVTLINLLGLVAVEETTAEGDPPATGPLDAVQVGLLDQICTALTQPAGCVTLLAMNSETTSTGSQNDIQVAGVNLPGVVGLGVAESHGSVSEGGGCQTAEGSSAVAGASLLGFITADALGSSSTSTACNDGTQSQTNESFAVDVNDNPIVPGCGSTTQPSVPNTTVLDLLPVLFAGCASDDSNGSQTGAPYGVREALNAFLLDLPIPALLPIKVATAGGESRAVAPGDDGTPPGPGPAPGDEGGQGGAGGDDGDDGDEGAGPAAGEAQAGGDELAFTGANLAVLGLIGGALMLGGVMLARASTRRHRRATV